MEEKKAAEFLKGLFKAFRKNHDLRRTDQDYLSFLESSEDAFLSRGCQLFESTFIEFGETFTTSYDVQSLLSNLGAFHVEAAILSISEQADAEHFKKLINTYYYHILVQLRGAHQQKLDESLFAPDIVLSLLTAITYFPDDVPMLLKYFSLYRQEKHMTAPSHASRNAVDTHLLPLFTFVSMQSSNSQGTAGHTIAGTAAAPYQAAISNLYKDEEKLVKNWISEMAAFHIAGSKDDWTLPFNSLMWQFFPIEIICLLKLRAKIGLSNSFIDHPLLKAFVPFLDTKIRLSAKMDSLRDRVLEVRSTDTDLKNHI